MTTDFDKSCAREVLPVLARKRAEDRDTDIVNGYLRSRRVQSPLLLAVVLLSVVGALSMFSIALSSGPLMPPGEQSRLVP